MTQPTALVLDLERVPIGRCSLFLKFILPIARAYGDNNDFQVIQLLRKFCPHLQPEFLRNIQCTPRELLTRLNVHVVKVAELLSSPKTTVKEILTYVNDTHLLELDQRLKII